MIIIHKKTTLFEGLKRKARYYIVDADCFLNKLQIYRSITTLLTGLCLLVSMQSYAQHVIEKGNMRLEIEVRKRGVALAIDSLCDGFDPATNNPINLIIPENSSLFIKRGPTLIDANFMVKTRQPRPIPQTSGSEYRSELSPGSTTIHTYIDDENADTLRFSWQVAYSRIELRGLYPSPYFSDYLSWKLQNPSKSYPDSLKYDWAQATYISTLDAGGIPVNPKFPFEERGLFFVVDHATEDAFIQLEGFHAQPKPYDSSKPYELFLYQDLPPGDYTFVVRPYKNAPDAVSLIYPFTVIKPWWLYLNFMLIFFFLLIVMVGMLLFLLYRRQQRKRETELEWKQKVSEAELRAIRAQLNPHFLFNSLSSIQNLVSKKNNEAANTYLTKLSRLLRQVLSASEHTFHELRSELEFIELYLDIEKLRFSFDYEISIDGEVDLDTLSPVMLLQPFVENAVKHGIATRKDGQVKIDIYLEDSLLVIEIKDNGPGLSKPNKNSVGLQLSKNRIQPLNQLYGQEVSIEVGERIDQHGVCVRISLPTN